VSAPSRTPLSSRPWLRALVLQLFVLANLAVGLHHLLEPHQLCAAHGVVEHGPAHAAAPADCGGAHEQDGPELRVGAGPAAQHAACELLDMLVPHARPAPAQLAPRPLASRAPAARAHAARLDGDPARYLLAPKHSPPAAL